MLEEAINYPRNGDDAVTTIIIGGVLSILSVFLLPAFLVFGYYGRVLRATAADESEPPVFDDWGDMFVDGLKLFAITLAYFLVPTIVLAISAGGMILAAISGSDAAIAGALGGALLGFSLAAILSLVAWYLVPAALANYARTDRLGSAFAFGELKGVLLSRDYAVGWLVALGVFFAAGIVVGLLNVVPFLGALAAAFVNFYAAVVAFYLYGHAFDDAFVEDREREAPAGQPVA
jgi:hypothetical protein